MEGKSLCVGKRFFCKRVRKTLMKLTLCIGIALVEQFGERFSMSFVVDIDLFVFLVLAKSDEVLVSE